MRKAILAALAGAAALCAHAGVNTWTPVGPDGGFVGSVRHLAGGRLIISSRKNIYLSDDNGANWSPVHFYDTYFELPRTIAVNPVHPDRFFVGAEKLFRSSGGAFGLDVIDPFSQDATTAVEFSNDAALVWHGTARGGVSRSTNSEIFQGPMSGLESLYPNPVLDIEVDATNHDIAYLLSPVGAFRTINGGTSWTPVTTPAPLELMAASRLATNTFLAVRADNRRLVLTTNGGDSFTAVGSDPIEVLAYSPGIAGRVLALTTDRRALRSDNHGQSWTQIGRLPLAEANDISISPTDENRIMVATRFGMVGSDDGGATWTVRNTGLVESHHLAVLTSGPPANRVFLLSGDQQTIYRRESGGVWAGVGSAAVDAADFGPVAAAVVSPSDPAVLYLARGGSLARSSDAAVTWTRLGAAPAFDRLAFSRSNPLLGFASGAGLGTHRTLDGGATWAPITTMPHDASALLVDPLDSNIVFAGTRAGAPGGTAIVYKSVDAGDNWAPLGGEITGDHAQQIVFRPGLTSTLYLLTNDRIWRSTNSGTTWSAYADPFVTTDLIDLEIDPRNPDVMYAVGADRSIAFRSPDGGITWDQIDLPNVSYRETSSAIRLVPGTPSTLVLTRNHSGAHETELAIDLSLDASLVELEYGVEQEVRLSVDFQGRYAPSRVRIEATLPTSSNGYDIETRGCDCTVVDRTLSCLQNQRFRLSGVSATLRFVPSVQGEQLTAQASAYEPDYNTANNSVLIGAERITDLEARIEGPASLVVGSTGTFTLTLLNHGPNNIGSVVRGSLTIPADLEFVSQQGALSCGFVAPTLNCGAGFLDQGTSKSGTITLRALRAGNHSLQAAVREDSSADRNALNDNAALALTVTAAPPAGGGGAGSGGGGGGGLDYLLLGILSVALLGRRRLAGVFRRGR